MGFFYGLGDEKFILYNTERPPKKNPLEDYCFKNISPVIRGLDKWEKDEPSIVFRATPDTLVQLCLNVIDKFNLPSPFEWGIDDVCLWIKRYGYPHYMNAFRTNMINGRTLLLVDAAALSDMNIKNFDDIRHITLGIRNLFFYEVAKYARSITLPQNELKELYKLFRVKTGLFYTDKMRSQYWRMMKFIREKPPNRNHWELLERWIRLIPERESPEVFAEIHRFNLYGCPLPPPQSQKTIFSKEFDRANAPIIYDVVKKGYNKCKKITPKVLRHSKDCPCDLPCECFYKREQYKEKWRFACLEKNDPKCTCFLPCYCPASKLKRVFDYDIPEDAKKCNCCPPCDCHWKPHEYDPPRVLSILQKELPYRYCNNFVVQPERPFVCGKCLRWRQPPKDVNESKTHLPWRYCRTWFSKRKQGFPCKKVYKDYWWPDTCNEMSEEHIPEEMEEMQPPSPKPKKKKFTCNSTSSDS